MRTYDMCYDVAKTCDSVKSFRKQFPREYYYSHKNRWINDFSWLKEDEQKYTYEKLYNLAKQYTSSAELKIEHYDEWQAMKRLQMIKDFTWLDQSRNKFTYEDCFSRAKKYKSIEEFKQFDKAYYKASSWHGWVIDYEWMKDCPKVESNYNECVINASSYNTPTKFLIGNPNLYWYCIKNKWMDSMKENIWKKNK